MSQLVIREQQVGDKLEVTFEGVFDEDVVFKPLKPSSQVALQLEKVEAINSCGIREWITWMQSMSDRTVIELHKCPKIIVDQINMVEGFLPKNGKVMSFFVPYFCEDEGEEKSILFKLGEHFTENSVNAPDQLVLDGKSFELDVIAAKYFKFIK